MSATKLTYLDIEEDLEVGGDLSVTGDSSVTGDQSVGGNSAVTGNETVGGALTVTGAAAAASLAGAIVGGQSITTAVDLALTAAQKKALYIGVAASAASKTVTLGLAEGQIAFVHNAGDTNAFTLKNVAADTGTSLAAGKVALVVGSPTANTSAVLALN